MTSQVSNLIDYLEYRKVCGEKTVELEPETISALKAMADGAGVASSAMAATSAAIPHAASPAKVATPATAVTPPTAATASAAPSGAAVDFLFVGEQEGIVADRAAYSETFRKMVAAMGYGKGQALFSNVCIGRKATTPPTAAEMASALPAFREYLAQTKPRAIVVLGNTAALGLLGQADVSAVHGRVFRFNGIPAIPTYHPAYMIKFPAVKRDACRDLCNALKAIGRPIPAALAPFQ